MKKLVIVESPTKTKSLGKYLGDGYVILASMGHVRDLPKSKMGIEIVEKGKNLFEFEPSYELMSGKGEQVKRLEDAAFRADEVILASDPDREGEAIAWHVEYILKKSNKLAKKKDLVFKRIAFHSITKEAVTEALENPRKIDMNLVDAQQARRFLDRLVGYKLSPILWKKVRRGLSAGRVQSVALRLIVEREKEIEAHKAKEYWLIKVILKSDNGDVFEAELNKKNGKKFQVADKDVATKVLSDLEKAQYLVIDVNKKKRKSSPHPPFKTSTLQQASANVLGWSAKRTMNVAQKLYEQGHITYHRTDSFNLVGGALESIRKTIAQKYGNSYLPETARFYKNGGKVTAQEAHEAIRPTHIDVDPMAFQKEEGAGDMAKLYQLIWRRTVSCQMSDAIFDDTKVTIEAGEYGLGASGAVIEFDGWKVLFAKDDEQKLPDLANGQMVKKEKVVGEQKFTLPPARYNDASLIKELEQKGIGRPSTYASIISTIIERHYVDQKEKKFFPTSIGEAVVSFLVKNFPEEMEYQFTAKMEDSLDSIASGSLRWQKMLSDFWKNFRTKINSVDKNAERVGVKAEETGKFCPVCKKGREVIRDGRFGKFLSCSLYPECKYTAPYMEYVEGSVCEKCGKRIVLKKTRKGKDFYGCEDYPNCTFASWRKPGVKKEEKAGLDETAI